MVTVRAALRCPHLSSDRRDRGSEEGVIRRDAYVSMQDAADSMQLFLRACSSGVGALDLVAAEVEEERFCDERVARSDRW